MSILIMLAVSVAGPSHAVVAVRGHGGGPPWELALHPSRLAVTAALWTATVLGGAGVMAGLLAVARGARPSARALVAASLLVIAAFSVLPAAGSTDSLDYAAYGRMVVLGRSPYQMTPSQLRRTGDPVGRAAPRPWQHVHSVYGPLATWEEAAAAALGGTSPAAIVFWLKLWNAAAFGVTVLMLDRLLRADPGRRARAHLLWSVNPLLLWGLIAAGHVDALAAVAGLAGLVLLTGRQLRDRVPDRHAWARAVAAGALTGLAADVKITFALFGLGVAWAARRSPRMLAAATAGALAAVVPAYLSFGGRDITVLLRRRTSTTIDNFYRFLARAGGLRGMPHTGTVAEIVFIALACLLVWRLPDGVPAAPAVRPALALSLAWLLAWPYQRPWYDALALCLLALYPLSRLDWPVLLREIAATGMAMPGMPGWPPGWLGRVQSLVQSGIVPAVRLAVLLAIVALCVSGAWRLPRAGEGMLPPERALIG